MDKFVLHSDYEPKGDQPQAIENLVNSVNLGNRHQTLLGVTGSGKTFTMANVIKETNRPALIIAPNKTLAAQLCGEFQAYFPENAVEYFVSYYDYYQPEAYVPHTDTYIEKDSSVNDEIDKLRHSATASLFERRDVIIVASVSCIYGLGSPEEYSKLMLSLREGQEYGRNKILRKLIEIQYTRNDIDFHRGTFRVRGDVIEIFPASFSGQAIRVELFGDEVERILEIDTLTGEVLGRRKHVSVFPASHYVTEEDKLKAAMVNIEKELEDRLKEFQAQGKLLEAQRLEQRTRYDLEMMQEIGFCQGIENYSRHLDGRNPGDPPYTLLDYFPKDFLLFIDESHMTVPQIGGMFAGDRSRKTTLVDFGFRLPSALDNRPLMFDEFEERVGQTIYVSATPADFESQHSSIIAEQIIRPTGLVDPEVEVRPVQGQIDDLLQEIRLREGKNQRVLVTTLTKRMAEDLTEYLREMGVKVRYMHSDIDTLERMEIIRDLRLGEFDVLVGINLLREGLDLPEVTLIAILDADKEGFLRSERALIQTMGRASRNVEGRVIMYADKITGSMSRAIGETDRRRQKQVDFNKQHNITPESIHKAVREVIEATAAAESPAGYVTKKEAQTMPKQEINRLIKDLEQQMHAASRQLEFEKAAQLRDLIIELRKEAK